MNIRSIKYTLLAALLALAGCADDTWEAPNGNYNEGEMVKLNLTVTVPRAEEVAVSRIGTDEISKLAVLVFTGTGDEATLQQIRLSGKDGTLTIAPGGQSATFSTELEATQSQATVYVIANANSDLTDVTEGSTLSSLRQSMTVSNSDDPMPLVGNMNVECIPHADLLKNDFELIRPYAKVTVTEQLADFELERFYLCNTQDEGNLFADEANLPSSEPNPADEALTHNSFMKQANEAQYTFPTKNGWYEDTNRPTKNTNIYLLVKGKYKGVSYYYHADFKQDSNPLDVKRNHHYQVTITKVDRIGYTNDLEGLKAAMRSAENMHIDIKDIDESDKYMASDGVTKLAVDNDTVYVNATNDQFSLNVYPAIESGATDQVKFSYNGDTWFNLSDPMETKIEGDQPYSVLTYTFQNVQSNIGTRRTVGVDIQYQGVMLHVVMVQAAEFNAYQFGTVSLKVQGKKDGALSTDHTYEDYWSFIQGKDGSDPVYGISSEAMGGKVRTEGFHAPMSDFLQFVYTFTLPTEFGGESLSGWSWKVEVDEPFDNKLLFS